MPLGVLNSAAFLTTSQLAVAANATIEVRRESDSALASIFSDRAGTAAITNPSAFADASGRFTFYVAASPGGFSIEVTSGAESFTLRNVPIGLGQEFDIVESWRSSLAAAISATITSLLGAATAAAARTALGFATWAIDAPRSHLAGMTLSTAGASATMSIAAGQATDSTNTSLMTLTAIAKTTAAWALGTAAGGLDTGTIANNTWYAFYAIQRVDTGVVDVTFSLNGTTPALPANYTLYRRIGWGLTNGSAQWVKFYQNNDRFIWDVPVLDVNSAATTTANRTARTLTAAPSCEVLVVVRWNTAAVGVVSEYVLLTSSEMTDTAASATQHSLSVSAGNTGATAQTASDVQRLLNSSRQMYDRGNTTGAVTYMTRGWIDFRGKDA